MFRLAHLRQILTRVVSCVLATAMCAILPVFGQSVTKDDNSAVLKRILAAWRARQAATRTLEVEANGERVFPKDGYTAMLDNPSDATGPVPSQDLKHSMRVRLLMDFDQNLLRHESRSAMMSLVPGSVGSLVPDEEDLVFNGKLRRRVVTKTASQNPDFFIYHGDGDTVVLTTQDKPFLLACGFPAAPDYHRLRPPFDEKGFELGERTIRQGRQCWVVRKRIGESPSWDEYCVDPERAGLILAWTQASSRSPGSPFSSAELEYDFSKPSQPLTRASVRDYFCENRIYVATTLNVTKFETNGLLKRDEFLRNRSHPGEK